MNTAEAHDAIGVLDVLYVREDSSEFGAVCDPEMRATQRELTNAIEAVKSLNGVYNATQSTDGECTVIKVQFNHATPATQKSAVYEAFAPKFVYGKGWAKVFRDSEGKHRNTFLRIDVPQRAAAEVVAKLNEVDGLAQFATTNECRDGRYITGIGFTMQEPTRDLELNRTTVAEVAEKLGVVLADKRFAVEENLLYASMPECNRENDPIDRGPSAV